jgi:hypothetical protein
MAFSCKVISIFLSKYNSIFCSGKCSIILSGNYTIFYSGKKHLQEFFLWKDELEQNYMDKPSKNAGIECGGKYYDSRLNVLASCPGSIYSNKNYAYKKA